jgi:hypothetical protein
LAANEVKPRTATKIIDSNKEYLESFGKRKFVEIPPEAGKPAKLTIQQAAYAFEGALKPWKPKKFSVKDTLP